MIIEIRLDLIFLLHSVIFTDLKVRISTGINNDCCMCSLRHNGPRVRALAQYTLVRAIPFKYRKQPFSSSRPTKTLPIKAKLGTVDDVVIC